MEKRLIIIIILCISGLLSHVSPSLSALSHNRYIYDYNGNTISQKQGITQSQLLYNTSNRLVYMNNEGPGVIIHKALYAYNHQGMRVKKTTGNLDKSYIYDNQAVALEKRKASDNGQKELLKYTYGSSRLISLNNQEPEALSQKHYYHYDALGSVSELSSQDYKSGDITAVYIYDVWGNIRSEQHWDNLVNRFTFTGKEYDEETGYFYFSARYYNPQNARFLNQDSYLGKTGKPPSLHRYLYCYGNPTTYIDHYGYEAQKNLLGKGWDFTKFKYTEWSFNVNYFFKRVGNYILPSLENLKGFVNTWCYFYFTQVAKDAIDQRGLILSYPNSPNRDLPPGVAKKLITLEQKEVLKNMITASSENLKNQAKDPAFYVAQMLKYPFFNSIIKGGDSMIITTSNNYNNNSFFLIPSTNNSLFIESPAAPLSTNISSFFWLSPSLPPARDLFEDTIDLIGSAISGLDSSLDRALTAIKNKQRIPDGYPSTPAKLANMWNGSSNLDMALSCLILTSDVIDEREAVLGESIYIPSTSYNLGDAMFEMRRIIKALRPPNHLDYQRAFSGNLPDLIYAANHILKNTLTEMGYTDEGKKYLSRQPSGWQGITTWESFLSHTLTLTRGYATSLITQLPKDIRDGLDIPFY